MEKKSLNPQAIAALRKNIRNPGFKDSMLALAFSAFVLFAMSLIPVIF